VIMKLQIIKNFLLEKQKDAIIITSQDEFNSEYVSKENNILYHATNFEGSNGMTIISQEKSYFLTDGRYLIEAQKLLENEFEILELSQQNIIQVMKKFQSSFFIQEILTFKQFQDFSQHTKLESISQSELFLLLKMDYKTSKKYYNFNSGEEQNSKIDKVISKLPSNIDYLLISDPISVCWLLNIRENQQYNGVHNLFALIAKNGEIKKFYNVEEINIQNKNILTNPQQISYHTHQHLKNKQNNLIDTNFDIIAILKSQKNEFEIEGFINCHKKDAIAVNNAIKIVKNRVQNGVQTTEYDCCEIFLQEREKQANFISESFHTIAGFAQNGAIVHYKPKKDLSQTIHKNNLLLIDSGGNYTDGTTDITRTIIIGEPTKEMIFHYTLVLKAHICLANFIFPAYVKANQLDAIARQVLWQNNIDYKHGTSHGVGFYLSVHEYPSISPNANYSLLPNQVISIEPGLYIENKYGIRLENLYLTIQNDKTKMMSFKPLTLVSFEEKLIDKQMLSKEETAWLENYQAECEKLLSA
jgi:Xaa-Pro aminopeptidase